ncbi:lymphocyte function-associated antigen 3 isoform X1 [Saccopteryx leptura]|uniref:lymphocyte function-associated antigen 3 isoform X1 n=1 Tax=Saccopteryx leptura TaxID=249018 RepID=UPI00339C77F3
MAAGDFVSWPAGVLIFIVVLSDLFGHINCRASSLFGTVQGTVTLSPSSTVPFSEMIWKKEKHKVTEWESGHDVQVYPPFIDRVNLSTTTGDLHISNLTLSDEGEYEIESPNLANVMKFNLIVLDPLPSPEVRCTLTNESILVTCEVSESYSRHRDKLSYSWHYPTSQCRKISDPGVSATVKENVLFCDKDADLSQEVRCFAVNSISNMTSSIYMSTCVPHDESRDRYGLVAIPVVLIFCVLLYLGVRKLKQRRSQVNTL